MSSFFHRGLVKKGQLRATVLGQPSYAMLSVKRNVFSIKEVPDCTMEFVLGPDGKVSELQFHQAGQHFSLNVKS